MPELADIVRRRRVPGVMILDRDGTLLFMNEIVKGIVPIIYGTGPEAPVAERPTVPEQIRALCAHESSEQSVPPAAAAGIFYDPQGTAYSLQLFPLSDMADGSDLRHIMVLVDKVIERHQVDFSAVQRDYRLSRREVDILRLLSMGFGNREISAQLFISEHTVKDHVKKILQAFGAGSRSEVISLLNR